MKTAVVYWSRRDFRVADNPALYAASEEVRGKKGELAPIFVLERYMSLGEPQEQFGYPQRLFLTKALPAFAAQFKEFTILSGNAVRAITALVAALRAAGYEPAVYVNEDIHPDFYAQVDALRNAGVDLTVFPDQMTIDPDTKTRTGKRYSVFTPFKTAVWRQFLEKPVLPRVDLSEVAFVPAALFQKLEGVLPPREDVLRKCISEDRRFEVQGNESHIFDCARLETPQISIEGWYISEQEAADAFLKYVDSGVKGYATRRDSLTADAEDTGTSRMSLALKWGLLSARMLREGIQREFGTDFLDISLKHPPITLEAPTQYLSELIWREFYKYLLFHRPELLEWEFQEKFRGAIAWVEEGEAVRRFTAWMRGETGYPIVDAAMMQIAQSGWMHNRARMIVASVLTKNLGVDWRWGQEYFRAQLIDLDEASNNGGWQWAASVGADPKPIRIFNPYLQAKKFDPERVYQKKWLGERSDAAFPPIIPHTAARDEALLRYGLSRTASWSSGIKKAPRRALI